jgi:UDP-glucose 4-epimerase
LELPNRRLPDILSEDPPFACINCLGRASVPLSVRDPLGDFSASIGTTIWILETLRQVLPDCIFLHCSSAAVYGNAPTLPIAETAPLRPISPYGFHKRMEEEACVEYNTLFGIRSASLRIFSAYGPGLHRQVIWDLIERLRGTPGDVFWIKGTGTESRDFIHSADVAAAMHAILSRGDLAGEVYNIASGVEVPIAEVARMIIAAAGRAVSPQFDGFYQAGFPTRWQADISRLGALGFEPQFALVRGIEELVKQASADSE